MDPTDTAALGRRLLDEFAEGWSRANVDRILGVFGDDPVFLETPFSTPLRGREALRRWWADVPYHQSEIRVTTGEVYVAGPWLATEFKAVFRRRRTGEWVDARGAIFCETGGGKITEMRMYWHRKSGREAE